jgi:arylsulfatase A
VAVSGVAPVVGTGAPATAARTSMTSGAGAGRPNIVLILLDDLGWGELGCYGQQVIQTPVIDNLASEGQRFSQAYANSVCAPTRGSLLTGLHMGHGRIRSNLDAPAGFQAEDVTVAEVLQATGYATAVVGKWGFGPDNGDSPSHPNRQGFDHYFGYSTHGHAHDYWPTHLWRNHERVRYPENAGADVTYAPELITQEALDFIDRSQHDPFFLYLCYNTPHAPNEIPDDAPYSDQDWPQGERNHAAQITWTDGQIGRVLERLDNLGLADDTLVLVVSDNGPHPEGVGYAHVGSTLPHDDEFFDSNGPLRDNKGSMYEGGIRVPLVVRLPARFRGGLPNGAVVREPVAVWDLLPTLADLAGTDVPAGLDGVSLLPLLTGRSEPERDYFYWEFNNEIRNDQAVRWGRWKAVRFDGAPVELYDIHHDWVEQTNLAATHPAQVRQAERLMAAATRPA